MMMMVQAPLPVAARLPRRRAGTEATPAARQKSLRKTFPIGAGMWPADKTKYVNVMPGRTGVGVIVAGSTTYQWVVETVNMMAEPGKWQQYYGSRPIFVFTSRSLAAPEGADVRFVQGQVADHLDAIQAAAGDDDVCVSGGGDLVGQFLDINALDEVTLGIAPVALAGGAPLLPRRVEAGPSPPRQRQPARPVRKRHLRRSHGRLTLAEGTPENRLRLLGDRH